VTARVVVHAGVDTEANEAVVTVLREAAASALAALDAGRSPVYAAVGAVTVLEDHPTLNAGLGSVLNAAGAAETDASVVDAATGRFAAVAALTGIRNPVRAAAALLDSEARGPALLAGEGARQFALQSGLDQADLVTPEQRAIWSHVREHGTGTARSLFTGRELSFSETVGAIVHRPGTSGGQGSLAAAASTGGMLMKRPGRVGDAAVFGAGLYADDDVALLCSGQGEATIALNLALRVALRTPVHGLVDALRWGVALGERRKQMRGGIVGYDPRSGTVAAVTNATSFPVLTATAAGDLVVDPLPPETAA
jgi:beta-aspartyl-peptidase (threonine type)